MNSMNIYLRFLVALVGLVMGLFISVIAVAAMEQAQEGEIYGWQLMSPEEQTDYQAKMRSLNTQEERNMLREEHHNQMQERAREKGLSLPDTPPAERGGMGPGGQGMGSGERMREGFGRKEPGGGGMGPGGGDKR